jgi:hypothetical protein
MPFAHGFATQPLLPRVAFGIFRGAGFRRRGVYTSIRRSVASRVTRSTRETERYKSKRFGEMIGPEGKGRDAFGSTGMPNGSLAAMSLR